ncbi:MAG: hypothetical protein SOT14_11570 [Succinivibrio sp.]|nr:hypothetical protein [Succinivibrio sp.]
MLHSNSPLKAFKKVRTLRLGAAGMTAAAFDAFGICDFLRPIIGKEGPNSRVDNPELLRAMCIQLLTVPHQSMAGTEEFFKPKLRPLMCGTFRPLAVRPVHEREV